MGADKTAQILTETAQKTTLKNRSKFGRNKGVIINNTIYSHSLLSGNGYEKALRAIRKPPSYDHSAPRDENNAPSNARKSPRDENERLAHHSARWCIVAHRCRRRIS